MSTKHALRKLQARPGMRSKSKVEQWITSNSAQDSIDDNDHQSQTSLDDVNKTRKDSEEMEDDQDDGLVQSQGLSVELVERKIFGVRTGDRLNFLRELTVTAECKSFFGCLVRLRFSLALFD